MDVKTIKFNAYVEEKYNYKCNSNRFRIPKMCNTIHEITISNIENACNVELLLNHNSVWEKKISESSITLPFTNETPLFVYLLDYSEIYLDFCKFDNSKNISFDVSLIGRTYPIICSNIKYNDVVHQNFFKNKNLVYYGGVATLNDTL